MSCVLTGLSDLSASNTCCMKNFLKLVYSLQLVLQIAHDMEEKWERLSEFFYTTNLQYLKAS